MSAPWIIATAPGKIILFGEHAVVYGRPAIAVPVSQMRATATVARAEPGQGLKLALPDVGEAVELARATADHPLAHVARLTLAAVGLEQPPDWLVTVRSQIPIASGLGSGAAVATALVRALSQAADHPLSASQVSALVFESEKLFHGTPSGIDNTVIAFERPVWFVRGERPLPFAIGRPFTIIIADTGIASPTRVTVAAVRQGWQADPARYEARFDAIATVVQAARQAIEQGNVADLGPLMDENHRLLQEIGVSCRELDRLWAAARSAGALGAKLSGAGRGGNLIALVPPEVEISGRITAALKASGAASVITTIIGAEDTPHGPP